MKILHVVSGLAKTAGGTTEAVPKICLAQALAGVEVTLVAFDGAHTEIVHISGNYLLYLTVRTINGLRERILVLGTAICSYEALHGTVREY